MAKFELRKTDEEALKARLKLVGKEGETFKQGIRAKLALLSNKTSVAAWLNNVSLSGPNASAVTYSTFGNSGTGGNKRTGGPYFQTELAYRRVISVPARLFLFYKTFHEKYWHNDNICLCSEKRSEIVLILRNGGKKRLNCHKFHNIPEFCP